MKNLLLILPFIVFFSCKQKQSFIITAEILNPVNKNITIYHPTTGQYDTLTYNENKNVYTGEIQINESSLLTLANGRNFIPLYAQPGFNIHLSVDITKLADAPQHISISGEGSLYSKLLFDLKASQITASKELLIMPPNSFDSLVQTNFKELLNYIDEQQKEHGFSSDFIDKVRFLEKLNMVKKYKNYSSYQQRHANKAAPLPLYFAEYAKDLPLTNINYFKEMSRYKYYVLGIYRDSIENQLSNTGLKRWTINYFNEKFNAIQALNIHQVIKDELGKRESIIYSMAPDSIQQVFKSRFQDIVKNDKYIMEFNTIVAKIDALKPGANAPTFAYNDKDGNLIKSENMKGKVIYIDVWATGCGPCRYEIPHMKKLEEALHNQEVAFVSVSVDQDKEAWLKMIAEKEMSGYQLHAPKAWESDIIKDYAIKGIPRFILIDQEGKLVNANATRPSNPETEKTILELLKS